MLPLGEDSNGRPVIDANGEPHTEKVRLERPQVFVAHVFNAEQIAGVPPAPSRECSWKPVIVRTTDRQRIRSICL
jgi:putative DNA primase/helicase